MNPSILNAAEIAYQTAPGGHSSSLQAAVQAALAAAEKTASIPAGRPEITDAMVKAATAHANLFGSVAISPDDMREVLEVALSTVPEHTGPMSPAQALDKATALVDKMSQPVTNARGYTDGWKAPSLTERVQAIRDLATLLMEGGAL